MDIIGLIISIIEIFGVFCLYNIFIYKNIFYKVGSNIVLSCITAIIYQIMVIYFSIDTMISLIVVLFINSIIISKINSKETILTLIEFVLSFLFVGIFELIATSIIHLIIGERDANPVVFLMLLITILFTLIFSVSWKPIMGKIDIEKMISKHKIINIIVVNLFMFLLLAKLLISNGLLDPEILLQISILGMLLIGVSCYLYMYIYNVLNEKKKREIKKSFNPLLNDLMGKLKANEHEYKNHLNTIWSIAQVSEVEEIKDKLKDYISEIIDDTDDFSRLINVENTIVKAVLYNKGQRAEKLGISYVYNVKSNLKDLSLDNSELTVVLSNLLNNAIEATSMLDKKELEVTIDEDVKSYRINVKNRAEGLNSDDLQNIFRIGFSTKGKGRGYGLNNVKKIVDAYKGKILISFEENIFDLTINFNK